MAVRCVFYTPGAEHTCQVLQVAGASPRIKQTRQMLEERYCTTGRFIACPMFNRVEQGLVVAHRFRRQSERTARQRQKIEIQAAS
jgi:hypothetical protein